MTADGAVDVTPSTDTYRSYYAAEFEEVIFILHAGSKKLHKDGEISREEIESLVKKRRAAEEYYRLHRAELKGRFEARRLNRARQLKDVC
jgi:phage-related protein